MTETRIIQGDAAMQAYGESLAPRFRDGQLVFVRGNLGAGKTTLIRGILQGMGHAGSVPSPTYTLLEPYDIHGRQVVHMDLYRLKDMDELENLGVRDFIGISLCFIEWPERAERLLPKPDWEIDISHQDDARQVCLTGPAV